MRLSPISCLILLLPGIAMLPACSSQPPGDQAAAVAAAEPAKQEPPPAYNIKTQSDLVKICSTPESDPYYSSAISLCAGYASGVLDYHMSLAARHAHAKHLVCLPSPLPTRKDAIAQFLAWAQAHPHYADAPAPFSLVRFMSAAWPCGKK